MSKVQFKDDETACIVCFCGKKKASRLVNELDPQQLLLFTDDASVKCLGLDKSCCPGSHVEQQSIPASPFIYNEGLFFLKAAIKYRFLMNIDSMQITHHRYPSRNKSGRQPMVD
jgi:hypothetical protein